MSNFKAGKLTKKKIDAEKSTVHCNKKVVLINFLLPVTCLFIIVFNEILSFCTKILRKSQGQMGQVRM